MTAIAAPADRRFHRAHVKPARRRAWRTVAQALVKYGILCAAGGYALYFSTARLTRSQVLQVSRVVVQGNTRLSTGEVLSLVDGLRGENLAWTNLETWRQRLLASPWVKDASLHRSLPSTIEVVITEREPIAIARIDGSLYLIDDRGQIVDDYGPQYADLDMPIVDGLSLPAGGADEARTSLTARFMASLKGKPELSRRISQIDVNDAHNAAVVLSGDPTVLYVGEDHFQQRIESYLDLSPALRDRVPQIEYVDLRFENRVYVRPAGGEKAKTQKAKGKS